MLPDGRRILPAAKSLPRDHRANRFIAALEPGDFAILEPYLEVVDLPRGRVLYDTGDTIRHAYFPHDAIISLVGAMEDGRLVEVALFGREGFCGYLGHLINDEAFGRYVVQIPGSGSRVELRHLHEAIRSRSTLRRQVFGYSDALLAQAFQTVACNAIHSVEARCCRWLLSTHDRVDHDALPLTHEFLAEMLGVQRSTVSAILRTLQATGLITQQRGGIVVTDRLGLEQAACECYSRIRYHFEKLLPGTYAPPDHNELTPSTQPVLPASAMAKPRR
ncbi:Crp/Fnr family transcriptional regulator [Microvirga pakistanensis]|uniref:Crp/Fnr family transcriptional regulator n=1 Tax=Microvirga pakistanensis TaxID=1682650 RepID=UPI00106C64E8|nr:Crp/Fnr family transcriptional regulator [Microvirga pakistanensis]